MRPQCCSGRRREAPSTATGTASAVRSSRTCVPTQSSAWWQPGTFPPLPSHPRGQMRAWMSVASGQAWQRQPILDPRDSPRGRRSGNEAIAAAVRPAPLWARFGACFLGPSSETQAGVPRSDCANDRGPPLALEGRRAHARVTGQGLRPGEFFSVQTPGGPQRAAVAGPDGTATVSVWHAGTATARMTSGERDISLRPGSWSDATWRGQPTLVSATP